MEGPVELFRRIKESHQGSRDLNRLFGLPPEFDITQARELSLPPKLMSYVREDIEGTKRDLRERSRVFQYEAGELKDMGYNMGDQLDPKELATSVRHYNYEWDDLPPALLTRIKRLFKPNLLLTFHTHPTVTADYVAQNTLFSEEIRNSLDPLHIAEIHNLVTARNFSDGDLKSFEIIRRFYVITSDLMGSTMGYRLLLKRPTIGKIQRWMSLSEYEKGVFVEQMQQLIDEALRIKQSYGRAGQPIPSLHDYVVGHRVIEKADKLLAGYAESNQLVAFGNEDYKSPVLKRLSV